MGVKNRGHQAQYQTGKVRLLEMQQLNCSLESEKLQWECEALKSCGLQQEMGVQVLKRHNFHPQQAS
eukprot:12894909-Prorocentrum_lima.AAC.1